MGEQEKIAEDVAEEEFEIVPKGESVKPAINYWKYTSLLSIGFLLAIALYLVSNGVSSASTETSFIGDISSAAKIALQNIFVGESTGEKLVQTVDLAASQSNAVTASKTLFTKTPGGPKNAAKALQTKNSKKDTSGNSGGYSQNPATLPSNKTVVAKVDAYPATPPDTGNAKQESTQQPKYFSLSITKTGEGRGSIQTSTGEIICGYNCASYSNSFAEKTSFKMTASPNDGSTFTGWTGDCAGTGECNIDLGKDTSVNATFKVIESASAPPPVTIVTAPSAAPSTSTTITQNQAPAEQKVLISEVMAGIDGNNDYEFIELYNPGSTPINLTGWTIKKKSSGGTETALVSASRLDNKVIAGGKYFLLANDGGYKGTVAPDATWAKSNTLAYTNNLVTLYNYNETTVDSAAWANIEKGQSFERESFTSSSFKAEPNPNPKNSL